VYDGDGRRDEAKVAVYQRSLAATTRRDPGPELTDEMRIYNCWSRNLGNGCLPG
jgi:hypothetical protein